VATGPVHGRGGDGRHQQGGAAKRRAPAAGRHPTLIPAHLGRGATLLRIARVASLQRTMGNQAVTGLVQRWRADAGDAGLRRAEFAPVQRAVPAHGATAVGPVLQRTVDSAAQALLAEGYNERMKLAAYKSWLKARVGSGYAKQTNAVVHGVGEGNFDDIVAAIIQIKNAGAAQERLNQAQRRLDQALTEAQDTPPGGVSRTVGAVTAYLDADQLPHQPPGGIAIGTRVANKEPGSRFGTYATAAWHQANTLVTMITWAAGLGLANGESQNTGQGEARADNIYYEGYALRVAGHTYVFFHCYPSPDFRHPT
jgi:hypothetical protein